MLIKASSSLRWSLIAASLVLTSSDLRAIDPVKRAEAQAKVDQPEGDVGGAAQAEGQQAPVPRDRERAERDSGGSLSRDISPQFQPPNMYRRGLILGVQVRYLDTGARIVRVLPNTPAWRYGLEPGDVVVAIDGYQIGYVNHRLYDLQSELNARVRHTGWVRLLVQNVRNSQLLNVDVHLAGRGGIFPRERDFDSQFDSEMKQSEGGVPERVEPSRSEREPRDSSAKTDRIE
jgi:PDZ domain